MFIVLEAPGDGTTTAREVCRGETLADITNAVEAEAIKLCSERRQAILPFGCDELKSSRARFRRALNDVARAAGLDPDDDDDGDDPDDATPIAVDVGGSD